MKSLLKIRLVKCTGGISGIKVQSVSQSVSQSARRFYRPNGHSCPIRGPPPCDNWELAVSIKADHKLEMAPFLVRCLLSAGLVTRLDFVFH